MGHHYEPRPAPNSLPLVCARIASGSSRTCGKVRARGRLPQFDERKAGAQRWPKRRSDTSQSPTRRTARQRAPIPLHEAHAAWRRPASRTLCGTAHRCVLRKSSRKAVGASAAVCPARGPPGCERGLCLPQHWRDLVVRGMGALAGRPRARGCERMINLRWASAARSLAQPPAAAREPREPSARPRRAGCDARAERLGGNCAQCGGVVVDMLTVTPPAPAGSSVAPQPLLAWCGALCRSRVSLKGRGARRLLPATSSAITSIPPLRFCSLSASRAGVFMPRASRAHAQRGHLKRSGGPAAGVVALLQPEMPEVPASSPSTIQSCAPGRRNHSC